MAKIRKTIQVEYDTTTETIADEIVQVGMKDLMKSLCRTTYVSSPAISLVKTEKTF